MGFRSTDRWGFTTAAVAPRLSDGNWYSLETDTMCGRFTLATTPEQVAKLFDLDSAPEFDRRYNIAPTQQVPVCGVRSEDAPRTIAELRWGLIPFWADDKGIGNRLINARSETAASKPAFRAAFKRRRCLIPATGFFEWRKEDGGKQPYLFRREDGAPFALAGLWEHWSDDDSDEEIDSFTILTCAPNEMVEPIHNRMPVILGAGDFDFWLDPANEDTDALQKMLGPFPFDDFECFAVSREINSPSNDRADLLEPLD